MPAFVGDGFRFALPILRRYDFAISRLIGNDAKLMDLLQRFRPATYWKVLAKRLARTADEKAK